MDRATIKHELHRHVVDSTAMVTIANPIYAFLEVLSGMTTGVSLNSRAISTAATYAGLGSLTKIRDFSKRKIGITADSSELAKGLHDVVFTATAVVGLKPLIYMASGETDLKKIIIATAATTMAGAVMAYPGGRLIDCYREIMGVEETNRLPKIVEDQSPRVQKGLAGLLTAGSVAAVGAVYVATPYVTPYVEQFLNNF